MTPLDQLLGWLDLVGIAVFAAAGALTASRKQLDPVGFVLVAALSAFGGGTLRDLLLGRLPLFWLEEPALLGVCAGVALCVFFTAHRLEDRFRALLWADAVGLALYAVVGAEIALRAGAEAWAAALLGVITATGGGILRDVVCNELPLVLRREIYVTAAAVGATVFVLLRDGDLMREPSFAAGVVAAFAIRAAALRYGWSVPAYKGRAGRER